MDDRDLQRAKWAVVSCAASVFVCWETFKHFFLMNVPMFTLHVVSTVVETAAAITVSALGVHLLGMVAEARRSQVSFGQVVGAALGTSVTLKTALRDIRAVADAMDGESPLPAEQAALRARLLRERIREIEHVMRTLSALTEESTSTPGACPLLPVRREGYRKPPSAQDLRPPSPSPTH